MSLFISIALIITHVLFITHCRFSALDSKGGISAVLTPIINFCDCSGSGTCLFTEPVEGQIRYSTFHQVKCACDVGYTGKAHSCCFSLP